MELQNSNLNNNEILLIELLADKYSRGILSLTSGKECSAQQLSSELGIPLATVYRKLKLLEGSKLIQHVKTIINMSGNEEKYYHCLIKKATLDFYEGKLSFSLKKDESDVKIVRLWQRLAHPNGRNSKV